MDMIGYDTQVLLSEAFYPATLDARASAPPMLRRMVAAGYLGIKNGRGLRTDESGPEVGPTPTYNLVEHGTSRSFPDLNEIRHDGQGNTEVTVHVGGGFESDSSKVAVLVELDLECLGVHTGEGCGEEGSNVLGFARYRNGNEMPSNLIELVRQPNSDPAAISAARSLFESLGYAVAVCLDMPGRIVDRLVRPKYNAALRFLDEGLASADAMDTTCKMGLGYANGPIERVVQGGLSRHHEICLNLYAMTGQPGYVPARRAQVAHLRENRK